MGSGSKSLRGTRAADGRTETYEGVLADGETRGDVLTKANIWGRDAFGCGDEDAAIDCG